MKLPRDFDTQPAGEATQDLHLLVDRILPTQFPWKTYSVPRVSTCSLPQRKPRECPHGLASGSFTTSQESATFGSSGKAGWNEEKSTRKQNLQEVRGRGSLEHLQAVEVLLDVLHVGPLRRFHRALPLAQLLQRALQLAHALRHAAQVQHAVPAKTIEGV